MLKNAIDDERKMQEAAVILDGMGYKKVCRHNRKIPV